MDTVDPNIPLQAGRNLPQFGPDYNALAQMQRTAIAVQQARAVQQSENALKQFFATPNAIDPKSFQPNMEAWSQLARIAPGAAMDLRNNLVTMQEKQARSTFTQGEIAKEYRDQGRDLAAKSISAYDGYLKTMPPEAALRKTQEEIYTPGLTDMKQGMPPEVAQRLSPTFDPIRARSTLADAKSIEAERKRQSDRAEHFQVHTDYGQERPTEYKLFDDGHATTMDGKLFRPTGVAEPKGKEADLYTVTTPSGDVTARRSPYGGFVNDNTGEILPDAKNPRKVTGKGEGEEYGKVSQIAIEDPENPSDTKIVPAQQNKKSGQWVTADANRDPLPTPKRIVSTGGSGRQAEAQAMAMINAGNEATGSLRNLVELPITATSGWFKGLTSDKPEALAAAIGRGVAGYVNENDARSLQISWQGIGRSLATLEAAGRATGLVGLQKQAEALQPQKGDSYTNVLRSYAEIRQIVERSIETMKSSPGVSSDQKKLLDRISTEAKTTVPWTVHDVNELEIGGKESVLAFAKKVKAGAAGRDEGPAAASAAIPPASTATPAPATGAAPEVTEQQYNALPSGAAYRVPGNPSVMYKR